MIDNATAQTWLSEAEAARHAILTSQNAQRLVHNGKEMVFNKGDLPALVQYINQLRAIVGQPSLSVGYKPARRLMIF